MIPPQFLQDLLSRTDIVDVVGQHVQLKKAGISHKGLCPFHNEKSPSFTVSATRQTYHCFGCGAHGNAVGFLMQHCGMPFPDAVGDLAQRVGMIVPTDERTEQDRQRAATLKKQQTSLSEFLSKASLQYQRQIAKHPHSAAYLTKRGLSPEIIEQFGLGYAPAGWRFLSTVFPDYEDPKWVECGLVITPDSQEDAGNTPQRKRYDRFRDRIMFPIRSVQGEVIGFGGRVIDAGEPKYLNSPETPIFSKGRELYGLHEARSDIRRKGYVLVVEGYMDVVALSQSGCPNAVATLGTACTPEHITKLFRFTDNIVFSFDGDAAGRRAASRALEVCLPFATDARSVRFLFLPSEHDPDSFVREFGTPAFEDCIERAIPLSKQLVEIAQRECDLSASEGRARFLVHAKPLWVALPQGALKRQLLADLARVGGLSTADLTDLWQSGTPTPTSPAQPRGTAQIRTPSRDTQLRPRQPTKHAARMAPSSPADHALRMLLLHSEWLEKLAPDDHDLIHHLPAPHGELGAWLERQVAEHGPLPWAALEASLREQTPAETLQRLVPVWALEDELEFQDLRRAIDTLWIEKLSLEQTQWAAAAAHDPQALKHYRAVSLRLSDLKKSVHLGNAEKL